MKKVTFIRPPSASYYNDTHIREDHQITYAIGYAKAEELGLEFKVFDFPLQRNITINDIILSGADVFVISARETGSNVHYAIRIAERLSDDGYKVILYGQVSRLRYHPVSKKIPVIETNEVHLYDLILNEVVLNSPIPKQPRLNFRPIPYIWNLDINTERLTRFKAALETTRGCQFKCSFCYINYRTSLEDRWLVKNNSDILADIQIYYQMGVRQFIFMDSEFLGSDSQTHNMRVELLEELSKKFVGIHFMIYCRADTIANFGHLNLLKQAGLYNVLIGVESFNDKDLTTMRKGQKAYSIEESISSLLDEDISITLSMITFNRNTTVKTLRDNISVLRRLHEHPNAQGLGMPNFVFNLEATWEPNVDAKILSDKTYVRWLMFYKEQPIGQRVVVDVNLEPLMEVYRVMLYEIATQVSMMTTGAKLELEFKKETTKWFQNIGMFIVQSMEIFLDKFCEGKLTLESLKENVSEWYEYIEYFNQKIRDNYPSFAITKNETLNSYQEGRFSYEDHGWDQYIPVSEQHFQRFLQGVM